MELIEFYVEDVKNRLPEKLHNEAERELRTVIEKTLPTEYTEEDVQRVLLDLGPPAEWAFSYRLKGKNFLLGPPYFEKYVRFLLLFAIISLFIACISALVNGIFSIEESTSIISFLVSLFVDLLVSAVNALASVFLFVTIAFIIIERIGIAADKIPSIKTPWLLNYKKTHNRKTFKHTITWTEVLFSFFWTIVWLIMLYHAEKWLGWYEQAGSGFENLTLIAPLFNQNVLWAYFPLLIGLAVFEFALGIFKLVSARWTFKLAFFNMIYHILSIVLLCVMLSNPALFHSDFIALMEGAIKVGDTGFDMNWNKLIWGFGLFIIFFTIIDIAKGFYHYVKNFRKSMG